MDVARSIYIWTSHKQPVETGQPGRGMLLLSLTTLAITALERLQMYQQYICFCTAGCRFYRWNSIEYLQFLNELFIVMAGTIPIKINSFTISW